MNNKLSEYISYNHMSRFVCHLLPLAVCDRLLAAYSLFELRLLSLSPLDDLPNRRCLPCRGCWRSDLNEQIRRME